MKNPPTETAVLTCVELGREPLITLLIRYGLTVVWIPPNSEIPGSFWGESEAGLIGDYLFVRDDTPVHSALHEACHYICMDAKRRAHLHTDAGGECIEENGVCYLQILLADALPGVGRARMCADMDAWGYSFRLGSARAWFEQDAEDVRAWLLESGLIDRDARPIWRVRQS
ncbi:MAG TPA: hypothetical protein PKY50_10045 [Candidatus Competibacter sp.]|nr:hypothetical protein [Candidatus Competibacter sp.]